MYTCWYVDFCMQTCFMQIFRVCYTCFTRSAIFVCRYQALCRFLYVYSVHFMQIFVCILSFMQNKKQPVYLSGLYPTKIFAMYTCFMQIYCMSILNTYVDWLHVYKALCRFLYVYIALCRFLYGILALCRFLYAYYLRSLCQNFCMHITCCYVDLCMYTCFMQQFMYVSAVCFMQIFVCLYCAVIWLRIFVCILALSVDFCMGYFALCRFLYVYLLEHVDFCMYTSNFMQIFDMYTLLLCRFLYRILAEYVDIYVCILALCRFMYVYLLQWLRFLYQYTCFMQIFPRMYRIALLGDFCMYTCFMQHYFMSTLLALMQTKKLYVYKKSLYSRPFCTVYSDFMVDILLLYTCFMQIFAKHVYTLLTCKQFLYV